MASLTCCCPPACPLTSSLPPLCLLCLDPSLIHSHLRPYEHWFNGDFDTWKSGLAGVASGSVAAALTTPLDVVKTRLMVNTYYKGMWDCAVSVARTEGLAGLFSGVVPRVVYIGPSTALFFVVSTTDTTTTAPTACCLEPWLACLEEEEPLTLFLLAFLPAWPMCGCPLQVYGAVKEYISVCGFGLCTIPDRQELARLRGGTTTAAHDRKDAGRGHRRGATIIMSAPRWRQDRH